MRASGRAWWALSSQFQLQMGWGGAALGGTEPLQRHTLHPGTWGAGAASCLPSQPLRLEPLPGWQGPGRRAAPDPHPHHPALALLLLPGGCPSRLTAAAPLSLPDHTLPPRNPQRPVHCAEPWFSSEHRHSSVSPPGNLWTHRQLDFGTDARLGPNSSPPTSWPVYLACPPCSTPRHQVADSQDPPLAGPQGRPAR